MAQQIRFENIKDLDFKTNEAYKRVRTNITFSGEDIRVVAVTSSIPNEGKSEVSFRLAQAFAEDGKKVLYIDADIRKSVTVARYGVDRETKGLSHYLSGQTKNLEDVIYETNIDNLSMIFTGAKAPNPAELLGRPKFANMLETLKEQYDFIILDCPPLGSVIDAVLVAKNCDGTILVIESDNVSYKMVQNVKKQLDQSDCKILGVVLNKVQSGGKGYYGYYKGYYGYYDDYGYGSEESGSDNKGRRGKRGKKGKNAENEE
ncbi:MAG: CpsD/CapB family tyrosine-protein kinase [Eubacterium sp.]|nr:CpsD/CapB family tyrosine-protein kinase [Eubacterium sp.]